MLITSIKLWQVWFKLKRLIKSQIKIGFVQTIKLVKTTKVNNFISLKSNWVKVNEIVVIIFHHFGNYQTLTGRIGGYGSCKSIGIIIFNVSSNFAKP